MIPDCSFKIKSGFTHLFLSTRRSFPELHGFSQLLSSSSGRSVAFQVRLYSTLQKPGQRSEDGNQSAIPTPHCQLETLQTSSSVKLTSRSSMSFSSERFGTSIVPVYLTPAFDSPGKTKRIQMSSEIQSLFIPLSSL